MPTLEIFDRAEEEYKRAVIILSSSSPDELLYLEPRSRNFKRQGELYMTEKLRAVQQDKVPNLDEIKAEATRRLNEEDR